MVLSGDHFEEDGHPHGWFLVLVFPALLLVYYLLCLTFGDPR